jgi:hypothetical protein
MLKRFGPVCAGLLVVAAFAIGVPSATGHPEECSTAAAWSSTDGGYSPYLSWQGAEESICLSKSVTSRYDDSDAELGKGERDEANLSLVSSTPKTGPFAGESAFNSDLAFEDGYAYQGNYEGVAIWDVRKGRSPKLVNQIVCPGSQNDVTINDGILITSTDSRRTNDGCSSTSTMTPGDRSTWEGIKVWDVRNPRSPKLLTSVFTDCGSHTHTVLPERKRLIVYVQSYDIGAGRYRCDTGADPLKAHDKISVVEVPRKNPAAAKVVNTPVLFPDGGNRGDDAGTRRTNGTTGCHDITVYQEIGLAAGACTGEGAIIDIKDPVNPKVIASVEDENFAFWHSATFSNDGKRVLFTDELGGGGQPTCNKTVSPDGTRGADAIYDITDPANPKLMSYFKIPREQGNTENCVAHNGNLVPVKGRDILVQSWYQGGVSVIDWTDGTNVKELAWFDRGPIDESRLVLGGFWSTYYYDGYVYGSEIQRGFDVFKLHGVGRTRDDDDTLNAQTQTRIGGGGEDEDDDD